MTSVLFTPAQARIPRNGRNFEYLSGEDPHLGAVLVLSLIHI